MAIAGRVAIVPKGDWSADATYKRLDAVTYNNTLYFAKKEVPAGTATTNTEYWSKSIVGNPDKSSDQQGQNLISYPYYSKSNTNNGITWTVNEDGTVTANGTATKESVFNIISPFDAKSRKTLELNQKYVLSDGTSDKTKAYTQFVRFNTSKNTYDYGISSRTGYNTWTASDENLLSYGIRLIVANRATVNNVVFKPMLEIGTVMHEYQPTTISNTTLGEKVNSFKQYEPDGKSMSVDGSGTLSINLDGTTITLDEAKNVIKLADTLKDKINGAFPAANVANNQITTEEGFALDARQANPNIDGTLAKQISDLSGSLNKIFNTHATCTDVLSLQYSSGYYITGEQTKNLPDNLTYGFLIILDSDNGLWRLLLYVPTLQNGIYTKFYNAYGNEGWHQWYKTKLSSL